MQLFLRWDEVILELPRRPAHPGPVGGRASISQIRVLQPLRIPSTQGQFCQERAVPQPTNFVPGNSYPLSSEWGLWSCQKVNWPFSNSDSLAPSKRFRGYWPHGLSVFGTSVGPDSHAALQYWLKPWVPPHAWRQLWVLSQLSHQLVTCSVTKPH